ncbi:MAG: NAD(P)/FAD-dependent oxidoreductase [Nitrososphaerota archaeon]|nr:NAD(P)/FAD-dependent oxidoreductase [Nitrososphaerota archaeon]MDG6918693.1 NAD(P)/FAD-dependent oxidoreductase [Nitrososphaerota archaeon]MDG6946686.1 NAD(P)/FAD-dependent oxidoreductase [Nitrososphaerota archaeon]
MSVSQILVLGGGVGGLVASNMLAERLGDRAKVTLVERKDKFQFPPSYPWLMLGMRRPDQVQKDLGALKKKGIKVINDEVSSIDVEKRVVGTKGGDLYYDHLVLALGAEYALDAVPGFREHARHIYDLESALRFKDAIERFQGGTVAIGISRTPFKCPAAPYEVAFLLEDHYRKKAIQDKVKFEFFTPESSPVPAVGPEIGNKVAELLRSRGINYHPKLRLEEIKQNELSFESGETIPFDLLFCVPPHVAPPPVVEAGLTNETGWIPVNPRTMETSHEGVYAVGDVTSIPTPSGYVPFLPKAGVFSHGQAEVAAKNIATKITGRGKAREWDGKGSCFLEVGGGQGAFVKGNFLAEPGPEIEFHMPGRVWHAQKVIFEKYWMRHWF